MIIYFSVLKRDNVFVNSTNQFKFFLEKGMPVIRIETNLPKTKITAEFVSRASKLSAELTQRPEQVSLRFLKI